MKLARTSQTTTMEVLNYMITNHIVFVLGIHGKNRSFNVSQYLQNRPVNPHRCSRDVSFMDILPPEVMCVRESDFMTLKSCPIATGSLSLSKERTLLTVLYQS